MRSNKISAASAKLSQSKLTDTEGWKLLRDEFIELVGKNAA